MNECIEGKRVRSAIVQTSNLVPYISGRGGVLYIYRDSILVG